MTGAAELRAVVARAMCESVGLDWTAQASFETSGGRNEMSDNKDPLVLFDNLVQDIYPWRLSFVNQEGRIILDAWFKTKSAARIAYDEYYRQVRRWFWPKVFRFSDDIPVMHVLLMDQVGAALLFEFSVTTELHVRLTAEMEIISRNITDARKATMDGGSVGFAGKK